MNLYPLHARIVTAPALLALVLILSTAEPGVSQIRPGIERGDYWGDVRARYRSEVLQEVGKLMEEWLTAWNEDDGGSIVETFVEDAVLMLDDAPAAGLGPIGEALGAKLSTAGPIEYSLTDFDVRGEMAFATTRFRYAENPGRSGSSEASGNLIWIFVKQGSSWKIRSQVFLRLQD